MPRVLDGLELPSSTLGHNDREFRMARVSLSERTIKSLISSALEGLIEEPTIEIGENNHIRVRGRIIVGDDDPEETRQFIKELLESELQNYIITVDGIFIRGDVPLNLVHYARSTAQLPDAVHSISALDPNNRRFEIKVRHQELFLGRKRNRDRKLRALCPDLEIVLSPLGTEFDVATLKTLPALRQWLSPFLLRSGILEPDNIHAYKTDIKKQSIVVYYNKKIDSGAIESLAKEIELATDVLVRFEYRLSKEDARSRIEAALAGLNGIEGSHISFLEKGRVFVVSVDAEQNLMETLSALSAELSATLGYLVEFKIDIQRNVMISRIAEVFPKDGILTAIKHIDRDLYDVEAYLPFDARMERLEAWSDEMDARWGAKILFSEAYMRSPDVRYRDRRGSDAETIALRYNRPLAFSPEALEEAERAAAIDFDKELKRREDIRGTVVLSIDPERTQDIDDALSVEECSDGTYEVGVHIADVSAFVEQDSALDREAMLRGFTTYLAEGEIPVIPPVLANRACSLHGGEDSLCMSVFLKMTSEGECIDYRVCRTLIHNHARLAYAQAQAMLDGRDHPYAWQVRTLGRLSRLMRAARKAAGALDLGLEDDPEKASHQLIEEFMLQANECVSRFLTENHPEKMSLFRIHPDVTETSMSALAELARHLRIEVKIRDQKSMQQALEEVYGTPRYDIFRFHLGRVLEKAVYHVDQLGHGALSKEDYAHFTSPIRRYTDLILHRLIQDVIEPKPDGPRSSYTREDLQIIADHLNHVEVRVDAASFESHRLRDLLRFDGARRTYTGRIISFMRGRMAIKTDETDLLIYVPYRDFKPDIMMPVSINDELSGRYFYLGEEVHVRTEGVDWRSKSIKARIVR